MDGEPQTDGFGRVSGDGIDGYLPFGPALARHLRLQGFVVGSCRQQQNMVRALEAGTMRPVIDCHFALDDLVAAFGFYPVNADTSKKADHGQS